MSDVTRTAVTRLDTVTDAQLAELAVLLIDCVHDGAEVSFMHPLSMERALSFWRGVAADSESGGRALLVAEHEGKIIGTVQVILAQPDNQPHRGDVAKTLVHPGARRQGLGASLMRAAEDTARQAGKTLLVLDTASGDAERVYRRLGWKFAGTIPGYALKPHGGLSSTSFFYRDLT